MVSLSKAEIRKLKARAQVLKALVRVGRQGVSEQWLRELDEALRHHELLKVKFEEFKESKDELAAQMASSTGSHLVTIVGHVAVLYRPKPESEPAASTPKA